MPTRDKSKARRGGGFTLLEVVFAITVLTVGLISLASVLVLVSHQREQSEARSLVLRRAEALIEELRRIDPVTLRATYDTLTYNVPGVHGTNTDGTTLTIEVDDTNPTLPWVTITGSWDAGGYDGSLQLETCIYNSKG